MVAENEARLTPGEWQRMEPSRASNILLAGKNALGMDRGTGQLAEWLIPKIGKQPLTPGLTILEQARRFRDTGEAQVYEGQGEQAGTLLLVWDSREGDDRLMLQLNTSEITGEEGIREMRAKIGDAQMAVLTRINQSGITRIAAWMGNETTVHGNVLLVARLHDYLRGQVDRGQIVNTLFTNEGGSPMDVSEQREILRNAGSFGIVCSLQWDAFKGKEGFIRTLEARLVGALPDTDQIVRGVVPEPDENTRRQVKWDDGKGGDMVNINGVTVPLGAVVRRR
ncbi:MAG: hypothetical protein WC686_00930 [Candidatus Shapirobacteria bacterium]|jgi:hypothetical protein